MEATNKIRFLNKEQLLQKIKQTGFGDVANILSVREINGDTLMKLDEIQILLWGIPMSERRRVITFVNEVKQRPSILLSKNNSNKPTGNIRVAKPPAPPPETAEKANPPLPPRIRENRHKTGKAIAEVRSEEERDSLTESDEWETEEEHYEPPPNLKNAPFRMDMNFIDLPGMPTEIYESLEKKDNYSWTLSTEIPNDHKPSGSFKFLSKMSDGPKELNTLTQNKNKNVVVRPPEESSLKGLRLLRQTSVKDSTPKGIIKTIQAPYNGTYENYDKKGLEYINTVSSKDLEILKTNPEPTNLALKLAEHLKQNRRKDSELELKSNFPSDGIHERNTKAMIDKDEQAKHKFGSRPLPGIPSVSDDDGTDKEDDEIYECFKKDDPIAQFNINRDPYFRHIDRKGAKQLLCKLEDGAFLFRPSEKYLLVLTVKHRDGYRNFGIQRFTNKLRLNAAKGSEAPDFANLKDFVKYFSEHPITFESNGTMLEVYLKPILSSQMK